MLKSDSCCPIIPGDRAPSLERIPCSYLGPKPAALSTPLMLSALPISLSATIASSYLATLVVSV